MANMITKCPSCQGSNLMVSQIDCRTCDTRFEGQFDIPEILQFSAAELNFILSFVKCSGSLKEMSKQFNVSYPTMRNRLNDIIQRIEAIPKDGKSTRESIISALERGEIDGAEAVKRLNKLSE